jgi:subtilase family serine protease
MDDTRVGSVSVLGVDDTARARSRPAPRLVTAAVAACVVVAGAAMTLGAASQPLVSLPGTVVPSVPGAHRVGPVDPGQRMSVAIGLNLHGAAELARLDAAVSTPGSPQYGRYLTPQQFASRFGPTAADVAVVRQFAVAAGLAVTGVSGNRQVVDVSGTAAQVSSVFHTGLSNYTDGTRTFYANDHAVALPAPVASVVAGVTGLDDHTVARRHAAPKVGPGDGLAPTALSAAYRFGQLGTNGTGVTVALWEFDGYDPTDLAAYDKQYSLSGPAVTTVSVDGASYDSAPGDGETEVELDSEVVRGLAPSATQLVYEAPNTSTGGIDMADKIVSDGKATVVSISWGQCEQDSTASYLTGIDDALSQAVAQGVSIYAATGDDGSRDCKQTATGGDVRAVDFPASSVYDTSVGGTTLTLGADGAWGSEVGWSGGGGGESASIAKPTWQSIGPGTQRMVPDVSADADPASGVAVYVAGSWTRAGGTSMAAPLWAAFTALYDQKALAAGKPALGFANPALYVVAKGPTAASALHDVTTGSNGDYSASAGYDEVTGVGTPIGDGLATALLAG